MLIDIWKRCENRWPATPRIAAVALAFAYPVLAHTASLLGSSSLTLASVVVLAAATLLRPLTEGRRWAWLALPLAALAIMGLWRIDAAALVLFLPPVLLNVFLAWLFGHTLARDSTPLIERVVRLLQPPGLPFEPGVIDYARSLTLLWTAFFLVLATTSLVLAALATPGGLLETAGIRAPAAVRLETWSLFANVLNYAIVAAFFLLEFAYRMRRFPDRPYRNLVEFLRLAAAAGPALAATFRMAGRSSAPEESEPRQALWTRLDVPADHPAFDGHFPGRPVLPAVALLGLVIDAAERELGKPLMITELPRAKFLVPLQPGDSASLSLRADREWLHFEVRNGAVRVAQGVFRIGSGSLPP